MDLWSIVGLVELGLGALLMARPALGRSLFAIEFHDRRAARFPRLYRISLYPVLKDNVEPVTKMLGIVLIVIGVLTAIPSI